MRTLVLLGLVVGGLVVAGAIHITQNGDQIDIAVDRDKVKAVAAEAVREGEQVLRNASVPQSGAAPTQTR